MARILPLMGALCLLFIGAAAAAATDAPPAPQDLSFSAWLAQQRGAAAPKASLTSAHHHNHLEKTSLCFRETSQHSCRNIGDWEGELDIVSEELDLLYLAAPGAFIMSDIACCKAEQYYGKQEADWSASLTDVTVGSCAWSIFWLFPFYQDFTIYPNYGIYTTDYLYMLGTASAQCMINKDVEEDCGAFCSQTTFELKGSLYAALVATSAYAVTGEGTPNWDRDCEQEWDWIPPRFSKENGFPPPEAKLRDARNVTRGGTGASPRRHQPKRSAYMEKFAAAKAANSAVRALRRSRNSNTKGKAADAAASVASAATPLDYHHYDDITITTPPQNQAWSFVIAGTVSEPVGLVDTGIEGGTFDFPIYTVSYFQPGEREYLAGVKLPTITPGTYNMRLLREPSLREQLERLKEEEGYAA